MIVANKVKNVRNDLGITQQDLACPYLSRGVISKVESGHTPLDFKRAIKFSDRLNEVKVQQNINLDYEITAEYLLGIERNDISEFLDELKNKNMLSNDELLKINGYLSKLSDSDAIKLILVTLEILKKDILVNANLIDEFLFKLINLNISTALLIDAYMDLIRIYYIVHQYELVVKFSKIIEPLIEKDTPDDLKIRFYYNLATAYFELKKLNESLILISKLKNFNIEDYELFILTLESNIYFYKNDLKLCEKLNKTIYRKSEKVKNFNFMANSCSNLAELYLKKHMFKKAKNFINKALGYICEIDDYFKYNVYYNKFLISISTETISLLMDFNNVYKVAYKLNDTDKQMNPLELICNYYKQTYDKESILTVLKIVQESNTNVKSHILLELLLIFDNADDVKKEIKKIKHF